MANDFLIRSIPLLGNVDLTNYHADIHDYEGFEKDNSLFINKRKVNWWKRETLNGEIGSLRGEADGDYFNVYKNNSLIGKISRQYYKLESVDPTAAQQDIVQRVVNPYPAEDSGGFRALAMCGKIWGSIDSFSGQKCGDYYFVADYENQMLYVYTEDNELYDTFSIYNTRSIDYVGFLYSGTTSTTFTYTYQGTYGSPQFTFILPANCVYIYVSSRSPRGYVYNIENKTVAAAATILSIRGASGYRLTYPTDTFNQGAYGSFEASIDYGKEYVYYYLVAINNHLYVALSQIFSGFTTNESKLFLDSSGTCLWSGSPGQQIIYGLKLEKGETTTNKSRYQLIYGDNSYTTEILTPSSAQYVCKVYNYSKKYGKWAVNYVDNVAVNIAHNYKKLFEIEGNESAGTVTDIDGYNDTYIYFHYGSVYYRISIATTNNFLEVAKSLNGIYYIFNTISYNNAYYSLGNDWFCSCDDWNNRAQFCSISSIGKELQFSSRLNNDWQTKSDVVSVSDLISSSLGFLPVTPDLATMTAYTSSATWDGESIIYTLSGDIVDTSLWDEGHSLSGYYYPTSYESNPSGITLYYVDENYTCPEYEDQNGDTQQQKYTGYFPKDVPLDEVQSLVQEGYISVDGWEVDINEGKIFTDPDDSSQIQNTPALLDTQYLIYTTSTIIMNNGGTYTAMTSSLLGGSWVLIYLNETETDPLKIGDSVFVINGIEYTYKGETNRILDYNGLWVCNTYLMKYLGFSTKFAYFYCDFDRSIYIFSGDNTMKKLIPLEKYTPSFSVYEDFGKVDTLNITSIDVLIVNLGTAAIILYEDQFVVIETGTINIWSIDESVGSFTINGVVYSIIKSALSVGIDEEEEVGFLPIEIETQFYGDEESEKNMINDCVYLTVDNLMSLVSGTVKIQAIALQNQKLIKAEEKTITLKREDFNELSQCLIKYQPKLQECRGFKLKISSDFEIAGLKIGASQGAINQTTKRV